MSYATEVQTTTPADAKLELAKWVISATSHGVSFKEGTVDLAQKVIHDALK